MLISREYFIHSFNVTEDLDDTYQKCRDVINMVPMSTSEKEKLRRDLEEIYKHFRSFNKDVSYPA